MAAVGTPAPPAPPAPGIDADLALYAASRPRPRRNLVHLLTPTDASRYGEDPVVIAALHGDSEGGASISRRARGAKDELKRVEAASIEEYVRESAGVADLRLHVSFLCQ
jgi:hypothetical protein